MPITVTELEDAPRAPSRHRWPDGTGRARQSQRRHLRPRATSTSCGTPGSSPLIAPGRQRGAPRDRHHQRPCAVALRDLPTARRGRSVGCAGVRRCTRRSSRSGSPAPDPSQPAWEEQREPCSRARPRASSGARSRPSRAAAATSPARRRPPRPPTANRSFPGSDLRGHRRQALRQRLGHHRPHDDHRRPRRRDPTRRSSCSTFATGRGTAAPG